MTDLTTFLPPKLLEISELCGLNTMLKIWSKYGGCHLSVPSSLSENHHLRNTLKDDELKKFHETYKGEVFMIPRAADLKRKVRNNLIRKLRSEGKYFFELAQQFNLGERQIITICKGVHIKDKSQVDIFTK